MITYISYNKKKNIEKDIKTKDVNENKVNKKKNKKVLRQPIEKKHFDFLMDKMEELETDEKIKFNIKLLNILLYLSGMRLNECLLLDKKNIENLLTTGSEKIYCKKTYTYRWIYIRSNMLETLMSNFKNGFNINDINEKGIVNKWGNKLTNRTSEIWMEKYFKLLTEKYGGNVSILKGTPWCMHSYRVNFINLMIRKHNIDIAKQMIGHRNVATTLAYYREMEIDDKKLDEIFGGIIF